MVEWINKQINALEPGKNVFYSYLKLQRKRRKLKMVKYNQIKLKDMDLSKQLSPLITSCHISKVTNINISKNQEQEKKCLLLFLSLKIDLTLLTYVENITSLIMSCQFKKTWKRNILGIWMKETNLFTNDMITYRKKSKGNYIQSIKINKGI